MELKVAFVIVCLCALAITSTDAGIPKCCITANSSIPRQILRRVQCWDEQSDTGPCNISALRLHIRGKKKKVICAAPSVKRMLFKMNIKYKAAC